MNRPNNSAKTALNPAVTTVIWHYAMASRQVSLIPAWPTIRRGVSRRMEENISTESHSLEAPKVIEPNSGPRTLLICHHDAPLDYESLARWMASFSNLVGVVILEEKRDQVKRRIQREHKRIGTFRFLDVLAFRLYYKAFLAGADTKWTETQVERFRGRYPEVEAPVLRSHSPNTPEVERFIREARPDIVIARCKFIMKEQVFSIPTVGTFVMHPGICPEYRNAHGCFWALAQDDVEHVGVSLLKIDKGVDTGPIYGYFGYQFDELRESHYRIQCRCVLDNLDALAAKLLEIYRGKAVAMDVTNRKSAAWGQPWMTAYLRWKSHARRRAR